MQRPEVVKALHAEGSVEGWQHCSSVVSSEFLALESIPSVALLPKLLETIPILLYAGEYDMVCNGIGIQNMISKLEWNGAVGFNGSTEENWEVDSKLAGSWTSARGLSYVNFLNASHMVPMDAPLPAHDMLSKTILLLL